MLVNCITLACNSHIYTSLTSTQSVVSYIYGKNTKLFTNMKYAGICIAHEQYSNVLSPQRHFIATCKHATNWMVDMCVCTCIEY